MGVTGNCYDLAIWLLDEFDNDGITAYPIGHDLGTDDAHVAVMALDEEGPGRNSLSSPKWESISSALRH